MPERGRPPHTAPQTEGTPELCLCERVSQSNSASASSSPATFPSPSPSASGELMFWCPYRDAPSRATSDRLARSHPLVLTTRTPHLSSRPLESLWYHPLLRFPRPPSLKLLQLHTRHLLRGHYQPLVRHQGRRYELPSALFPSADRNARDAENGGRRAGHGQHGEHPLGRGGIQGHQAEERVLPFQVRPRVLLRAKGLRVLLVLLHGVLLYGGKG